MNSIVLRHALPFIDFRGLVAVTAVCRAWNVTADVDMLWQRLCECYSIPMADTLGASYKATFVRHMNAALTPGPVTSAAETMGTVAESLHSLTANFYATAPFLTSSSRNVLAQQQVDKLRQHTVRCASALDDFPQKIEATAAAVLRLEQNFGAAREGPMDDIGRRADTLLAELRSRGSHVGSFAAFERKVLRGLLAKAPRGVNRGIATFVDMELRFGSALYREPIAAEWAVWKARFPLDDLYYDLRDEMCHGKGVLLAGSPEERVWRAVQSVLVE